MLVCENDYIFPLLVTSNPFLYFPTEHEINDFVFPNIFLSYWHLFLYIRFPRLSKYEIFIMGTMLVLFTKIFVAVLYNSDIEKIFAVIHVVSTPLFIAFGFKLPQKD